MQGPGSVNRLGSCGSAACPLFGFDIDRPLLKPDYIPVWGVQHARLLAESSHLQQRSPPRIVVHSRGRLRDRPTIMDPDWKRLAFSTQLPPQTSAYPYHKGNPLDQFESNLFGNCHILSLGGMSEGRRIRSSERS